jgi:hypothetical protein
MIIYLTPLSRGARRACAHRDATIPEDQRAGCPPSVLSCTAWGFSCLANCSASGELLPRLFTLACPRRGKLTASPTVAHSCQRTGGVFSVTLSVTAILQLRRPRVLRGMSPYGVRTFLQQAASGSPAIICHRRQFSMITIEEKRTADYADKNGRIHMRCAEEEVANRQASALVLLTSRDVSTPLDMTRTRRAAARS